MPRFLSQHTLASLTLQDAEALARRMQSSLAARVRRVVVNMVEGKMFAELVMDSRESLEAWFKAESIHFDWIIRIELETQEADGELRPAD